MKITELSFLTDENIDPDVVSYLRSRGFDLMDVVESGWEGMDDEQILDKAHSQGRTVMTHDSDFGTLAIAAGKPFTGIIYLKPGHIKTEFTLQSVAALLEKVEDVAPPFIIVAHHGQSGIRIRYRQK